MGDPHEVTFQDAWGLQAHGGLVGQSLAALEGPKTDEVAGRRRVLARETLTLGVQAPCEGDLRDRLEGPSCLTEALRTGMATLK